MANAGLGLDSAALLYPSIFNTSDCNIFKLLHSIMTMASFLQSRDLNWVPDGFHALS